MWLGSGGIFVTISIYIAESHSFVRYSNKFIEICLQHKLATKVLRLHRILSKIFQCWWYINGFSIAFVCNLKMHYLFYLQFNPSGLLVTEVYYNCIMYTYMPLEICIKLQLFLFFYIISDLNGSKHVDSLPYPI